MLIERTNKEVIIGFQLQLTQQNYSDLLII